MYVYTVLMHMEYFRDSQILHIWQSYLCLNVYVHLNIPSLADIFVFANAYEVLSDSHKDFIFL